MPINDNERQAVVDAISCLAIPYGTAVGVFTFIVLGRPSVKPLFAHA